MYITLEDESVVRKRLEKLPLKVGMIMVPRTETIDTREFLTIIGFTMVGSKRELRYAWIAPGGYLKFGGVASEETVRNWAIGERVDFIYTLCTNNLGDFPRKTKEEG